MGRSDDYRRFAQECLEIARATESPRICAMLFKMAQVWLRLAENHADTRAKEPAD